MTNAFFDQFSFFGKSTLEPTIKLNNITTRLVSEMGRQGISASNGFVKEVTEQAKVLSTAKGIEEVVSAQTNLISKVAANVNNNAQQFLDTVVESSTEYQKCIQEIFSKAF